MSTPLSERNVVGAAGAKGRYQLSPSSSIGGTVVVISGPIFAAALYGRLHLLEGRLAPTLGLGGGSSFDGLDYATVDCNLPVGHKLADWEFYLAPAIGLSLVVGNAVEQDTLVLGGAAGAILELTTDLELGVELGIGSVHPLGPDTSSLGYAGAAMFLRYLIPARDP